MWKNTPTSEKIACGVIVLAFSSFMYFWILPALFEAAAAARKEGQLMGQCQRDNGVVIKDIEAKVLRCIKYDFTIIENDLNGMAAK